MKGLYTIVAVFTLLTVSCNKKALPEPAAEEPDFFVDATISEQPVLREAGNSDYYMNSSYGFVDSTSVYVVKGDLSKPCSNGCDYGFAVFINDFHTSAKGTPMDISKTLVKGSYLYTDKIFPSTLFNLNLKPVEPYNSRNSYTWQVISNNAPEIKAVGYNFPSSHQLKAGDVYTITLFTDDISGCFTQHSRIYKVGTTLGNIEAVRTSANLDYNFSVKNFPGQPGDSYLWSFGDGGSLEGKDVTHQFTLQPGYYDTKLQIITVNKDTVEFHYQIPGTVDQICLANFDSDFTGIPVKRSYSRVTVEVTDPSGKVFTTSYVDQPVTSFFNIDEISDYQNNKNGEPTKKLQIRLSCTLRNGTEQIELKNGRASIAVAYK